MSTPRLMHNVYFKLKDASESSIQAMVAACKKYLNVQPGILFFAAGTLVKELTREVNDQDWDVALHILFQDKASHDQYQLDPQHQQFISENKGNWAKVRVYDSYV